MPADPAHSGTSPGYVPGSDIPIQNIYYLISYAWNALEEKNALVDVDAEDSTDLLNLFARVLITGTHRLIRKGLDRGYLGFEDVIAGVRGKLITTPTLRRGLLRQARAMCAWDELDYGTLPNRILKSTLKTLVDSDELDKPNVSAGRDMLRWLAPIPLIDIRREHFRRVQLHRNNRMYAFLLNTCEMVHEHWLPAEGGSRRRFRDFERNALPALFESFVFNFYDHELGDRWSVTAPVLDWDRADFNREATELVPRMETDVCIQGPGRAIILDTKFYKNALASGRFGGQKLSADNLYQIFTYLRQRSSVPGWENAEGVLLYPRTSRSFNVEFATHGHRIRAVTIDLYQPWKDIRAALLGVIETTPS